MISTPGATNRSPRTFRNDGIQERRSALHAGISSVLGEAGSPRCHGGELMAEGLFPRLQLAPVPVILIWLLRQVTHACDLNTASA